MTDRAKKYLEKNDFPITVKHHFTPKESYTTKTQRFNLAQLLAHYAEIRVKEETKELTDRFKVIADQNRLHLELWTKSKTELTTAKEAIEKFRDIVESPLADIVEVQNRWDELFNNEPNNS